MIDEHIPRNWFRRYVWKEACGLALYAIAVIVVLASIDALAHSYTGLYAWALHHRLGGWQAMTWPAEIDVFLVIGELALYVAYAAGVFGDDPLPNPALTTWSVLTDGKVDLQFFPGHNGEEDDDDEAADLDQRLLVDAARIILDATANGQPVSRSAPRTRPPLLQRPTPRHRRRDQLVHGPSRIRGSVRGLDVLPGVPLIGVFP